jgi:hypothetical protein
MINPILAKTLVQTILPLAELLASSQTHLTPKVIPATQLNQLRTGVLVQPVPERLETGTSFFECTPDDKTGQHWFYSVGSSTPVEQYTNEYLNFLSQCTGQVRGPLDSSDPAVQEYMELRYGEPDQNKQSFNFSLPLGQFPLQGLQASSVS